MFNVNCRRRQCKKLNDNKEYFNNNSCSINRCSLLNKQYSKDDDPFEPKINKNKGDERESVTKAEIEYVRSIKNITINVIGKETCYF